MRGGPRRRCPARKVKRQDWLCRARWSIVRPLRLRYTIRPPHRKPTTWSCKPWAARQRQENQRRQSRCRRHRPWLHQPRHSNAHQRAPHLRHRRPRRVAHVGAQGCARSACRCGSDSRRDAVQQGTCSRCLQCRVIPSVAFTDPEFAWVGLTEDCGLARRASKSKIFSPGRRQAAPLPMAEMKA